MFVGVPQLQVGLEAARVAGIPKDRIWIMGMPGFEKADGFVTVEELIAEGTKSPEIEPLRWAPGQGARQAAFLCYSSGTSGLPKAVMISHRNVIANSMQYAVHETYGRKKFGVDTQSALGLLPFSHIYGLVVVAHSNVWRGDEVVVLPSFEMSTFLAAIERFKLNQLYLVRSLCSGENASECRSTDTWLQVPPIVIRMTRMPEVCKKYNLDSVRVVFCGAAPLGEETIQDMMRLFPKMRVAQGYGSLVPATLDAWQSHHENAC